MWRVLVIFGGGKSSEKGFLVKSCLLKIFLFIYFFDIVFLNFEGVYDLLIIFIDNFLRNYCRKLVLIFL